MSEKPKIPEPSLKGYIALAVAIVIFSGLFSKIDGPLSVLDFSTLIGKFGNIAEKFTFRGKGGAGARDGFLFALSLAPTVIASLGIVKVVESLGGLAAGAKLLTRVLKLIMGIPGIAALALVASLNSSDAGAAMTRTLKDQDFLTDQERDIFVAFQFSGSATIVNYFASGAALFGIIKTGVGLPLLIILILKLFGANIVRIYHKYSKSKGESVNA